VDLKGRSKIEITIVLQNTGERPLQDLSIKLEIKPKGLLADEALADKIPFGRIDVKDKKSADPIPLTVLNRGTAEISVIAQSGNKALPNGDASRVLKIVLDPRPAPSLNISVELPRAPILLNSPTDLRLTMTNTGPIELKNCSLTIQIPSGIELLAGEKVETVSRLNPNQALTFAYTLQVKSKERQEIPLQVIADGYTTSYEQGIPLSVNMTETQQQFEKHYQRCYSLFYRENKRDQALSECLQAKRLQPTNVRVRRLTQTIERNLKATE
jgi:uncharacterized membrane protein